MSPYPETAVDPQIEQLLKHFESDPSKYDQMVTLVMSPDTPLDNKNKLIDTLTGLGSTILLLPSGNEARLVDGGNIAVEGYPYKPTPREDLFVGALNVATNLALNGVSQRAQSGAQVSEAELKLGAETQRKAASWIIGILTDPNNALNPTWKPFLRRYTMLMLDQDGQFREDSDFTKIFRNSLSFANSTVLTQAADNVRIKCMNYGDYVYASDENRGMGNKGDSVIGVFNLSTFKAPISPRRSN